MGSCAIDGSGHVQCWGNPGNGRTLPPDPTAIFSSVACGFHHTCGVRVDSAGATAGTTVCWGMGGDGQASPPAENMRQVCAGYKHSCGVRDEDGGVVCWGRNQEGQTNAYDPDDGNADILVARSLACGYKHTCVIKAGTGGITRGMDGNIHGGAEYGESEGELFCFGENDKGQTETPRGRFASLTVGGKFGCALKYGEKFPAGGRHPAYPMQGESVLCWGGMDPAQEQAAVDEITGGGQRLGKAAREDWLFFLPRLNERHYQ